jgi:hypothetical protein
MDAQAAVIETANYAAMQSDRWLFVALLIIGLLAIGVLFKFFTSRLDNLQQRMDRQTEDFVSHLKTANKEMLEVIASAQETIAKNTNLIERVERKLELIK